MIITTINDAQQQQQENSATTTSGWWWEEEPGSYVISELGWGALRKDRVCGLVLNQTEQRSATIQLTQNPSEDRRRTNQHTR